MSGRPRYRPHGWLHAGTNTGGGGVKGRVRDGAEEKPQQEWTDAWTDQGSERRVGKQAAGVGVGGRGEWSVTNGGGG